MIGLFFLFIIIIWILICIPITKWIDKKINIKKPMLQMVVHPIIFMLVFISPLADEIIAKPFYDDMCNKYNKVFKLADDIAYQEVLEKTEFKNIYLGTIKIQQIKHIFIKIKTNKIIVYDIWLYPSGGIIGRFIDFLGFEHSHALLLNNCQPKASPHDLNMIVK